MAQDTKQRSFTSGQLETIAKIIGDTDNGLKGSEIEYFLRSANIQDVDPLDTKWKRIYSAFINAHNNNGHDNRVLGFIAQALEPSRYTQNKEQFDFLVSRLNPVLAFQGLEFKDDGNFHTVKEIKTLTESQEKASLLIKMINDRKLHPELINYCREELIKNNYYHAVFEAVKGISAMLRKKTGLTTDGSELFNKTFGGNTPLLLINNYITDTEKSQQRGFVNLLTGIFGTFRSQPAHSAKIDWNIEEQDALDLFAIASYAYRKIDQSKPNLQAKQT
jgi:uncharacterized protein (TIGR02391 family)